MLRCARRRAHPEIASNNVSAKGTTSSDPLCVSPSPAGGVVVVSVGGVVVVSVGGVVVVSVGGGVVVSVGVRRGLGRRCVVVSVGGVVVVSVGGGRGLGRRRRRGLGRRRRRGLGRRRRRGLGRRRRRGLGRRRRRGLGRRRRRGLGRRRRRGLGRRRRRGLGRRRRRGLGRGWARFRRGLRARRRFRCWRRHRRRRDIVVKDDLPEDRDEKLLCLRWKRRPDGGQCLRDRLVQWRDVDPGRFGCGTIVDQRGGDLCDLLVRRVRQRRFEVIEGVPRGHQVCAPDDRRHERRSRHVASDRERKER